MDYILAITSFLIATVFGIATFALCLHDLSKDPGPSRRLIIFLVLGILKATIWLLYIDKKSEPLLFIGLLVEALLLLSIVIFLLLRNKIIIDRGHG